jgi:hypothetical protein
MMLLPEQILKRNSKNLPPDSSMNERDTLLPFVGEITGRNMVSRPTWQPTSACPAPGFLASQPRVTRAMEIRSYSKDQQFTGRTLSVGGMVAAQRY